MLMKPFTNGIFDFWTRKTNTGETVEAGAKVDHKHTASPGADIFGVSNTDSGYLDVSHLTRQSTLADLPTDRFAVPASTLGEEVAAEFHQRRKLSGVLVIEDERVIGAFSREKFLERVGRLYGVEVYLNRPIKVMLEAITPHNLRLPSDCDIPVAVQAALSRSAEFVYEPIIVDFPNRPSRLLNIYVLLLAQSQTFSLMTAELSQTLDELTKRSEDLEKANSAISRHVLQLKASNRVAQQVTSILEVDKLLSEVVNLIQARFGYYFVGIWLLCEPEEMVILQAMAGEIEDDSLKPGYQISLQTPTPTVQACLTGQYQLVDALHQHPEYTALSALPDIQSNLALPLNLGKTRIGVLDIRSESPTAFNSEDLLALQTLANQIAIAINNAQLYKQEQKQRQWAEAVEQAGRALTSNLDMNQVSGMILDQLATVVPHKRGAVFLQQGDILRPLARRGFPQNEQAEQLQLQIQIRPDDIFQRLVKSRQYIIVDDVTQESGWYQLDWLPKNHSWMGVPLIAKNKVVGFISLTRPRAGAFSAEEATLVQTFAGQAAVALENARLYDEITQFNDQLEQMVQARTQELNRAYQSLEQMDKAKSDFISVTSHELRTPLTVINGYTQILKTMVQGDSMRELLDGILAGAERMHEVVNTMLDITKIENQKLQPHKEEVYLSAVLDRLGGDFEDALQKRSLTLTANHLAELPPLQADSDLILKLLIHLLVNAIKYTPDGGQITITGRLVETNQVEIVVADTGIGIEPAHLELIFEKFYQTGEIALHSSGKTKFKGGGPGLGLAVARGIVQAHGGQIWAESEAHDEERCPGSKFFVRLPLE